MAKKSAKQGAKASKPSIPIQSKPPPSTTSKPPAPYSRPPPVLRPFLESLNPAHIYIVHIDEHPWYFKRRIFSVPVITNVVLAGLLLWRAQVALPHYAAILFSLLGLESSAKVDTKNSEWGELMQIGIARASMFFCDWALAKYIVPWPMDFFVGSPASPIQWRWTVGFKDREVVVRKSRRWDKSLPKDWLAEDADPAVYQEKIMPAVDRKWIKDKTGYLMMDKNWDLDFQGMITAHKLISEGKMSLDDFKKTVIVYSEDHGWIIWALHKLDEGAEDEGRKKIILFKDKLTAMGKENLFFKWIELIQYETSQPGGFTAERQRATMTKAKELFESQGVDFDQFWKEVGGVQGMPGLSSSPS